MDTSGREGEGREGKGTGEERTVLGIAAASHIVTWTCEQIESEDVGKLATQACIFDSLSRAREYEFMHVAGRSDRLERYRH